MDMLFFEAANKILNMYDLRQQCSKNISPDSSSEIHWGSEMLSTLAGVAAYTGCPGSVVIHTAAQEWYRSGKRPSDFILTPEGSQL